MGDFLSSPYFGISLTVGAYLFGAWAYRKSRLTVLNPLVAAVALIIAVLLLCRIDYAAYAAGADYIGVFLMPATVCLAIPIYRKRALLKKNFLPVLCGCAAGAAVCLVSARLLCGLFGLDAEMMKSILPKSLTTPFGIALSQSMGGIPSVTVVCIIITGVFGAVAAPWMIRLFRVRDPMAAGLAIGAASHALGTSKALELGETEGAMSGLAISVTGIVTMAYALFFAL